MVLLLWRVFIDVDFLKASTIGQTTPLYFSLETFFGLTVHGKKTDWEGEIFSSNIFLKYEGDEPELALRHIKLYLYHNE